MIKIGQFQQNQQRTTNYPAYGAAGAVAGLASRYVVPTKDEMVQILNNNKPSIDTFVSNTATKARGEKHSALAFAAIGAAVVAGAKAISNALKPKKVEDDPNITYTDLGTIIDAQGDAAAMLLLYS